MNVFLKRMLHCLAQATGKNWTSLYYSHFPCPQGSCCGVVQLK